MVSCVYLKIDGIAPSHFSIASSPFSIVPSPFSIALSPFSIAPSPFSIALSPFLDSSAFGYGFMFRVPHWGCASVAQWARVRVRVRSWFLCDSCTTLVGSRYTKPEPPSCVVDLLLNLPHPSNKRTTPTSVSHLEWRNVCTDLGILELRLNVL